MYYEINVAFHGQHFFATAERSLKSEHEAKQVYKAIKEKFPESEGYEISVSRWEKSGRTINFN